MNNTLKQLWECSQGKNIPTEFANENIDYKAALRDELKKLAGTPKLLRRNGADVFDLLEEVAEEVVPNKVMDLIGAFAEVRQYGNNDRLTFVVKRGKQRGKSYVTRATAAGVYETFRLDSDVMELGSFAIAGGGIIDFERYLDGSEDLMDIYEVIVEGMTDRIFEEIYNCLVHSWNDTGRPSANKVAANGFDPAKMAKIVRTVSAYGIPVIYCGAEFAASIVNMQAIDADHINESKQDIIDLREQGYVGKFAGAPVVVLPNSFVDETNTKTIFDPRFAFVLPAGKEKIVKVALIGDTHMKQVENEDWSMEIQGYKKVGVGLASAPNYWGIYYNSAIEAEGFDAGWMN